MEVVAFAICLIFCVSIFYLITRRVERRKALKEFEVQSIQLKEQLSNAERETAGMSIKLKECSDRLTEEIATRAAAQERSKQIDVLTEAIGEKDKEIRSNLQKLSELNSRCVELQTTLSSERKLLGEQQSNFEESKKSLLDAFKSLSVDTLRENSEQFMRIATHKLEQVTTIARTDMERQQLEVAATIKPIKDALEKVDVKIGDIEKARENAYASISAHVSNMKETNELLRMETGNLVKALRSPQGRGHWGEFTLKNVVKMAGMTEHCDFVEQEVLPTEESNLRPDMIVNLPGNRNIVVDAKAVIVSYLEANQTDDDEVRKIKLQEHARHVRDRVTALSKKKYADNLDNSPDFVVLYLPGESIWRAALEADPSLIEFQLGQNVLIATPMNLIAMLKMAAYGWTEQALAENAQHISELGRELHKRISTMAEHFANLGVKLGGAVESYNRAIGSLERKVLVQTRKFHELHASGSSETIDILEPIAEIPSSMQSAEMRLLSDAKEQE